MEIKYTNQEVIHCNHQYDDKYITIVFDNLVNAKLLLQFPKAVPSLENPQKLITETSVPIVDNKWTISQSYLKHSGIIYAQIVENIEGQYVKHGDIFKLIVDKSLGNGEPIEDIPFQFKSKFDEMVKVINEVQAKLDNGEFNGKSAYQVAVDNGFKGTEKEWLESLDYDHSQEFTDLANQVRTDSQQVIKDKTHVDKAVKEFNISVTQAQINIDAKVNEVNANALQVSQDKAQVNQDALQVSQDKIHVDTVVKEFDTVTTQANKNFTDKVSQANNLFDAKVLSANQGIDTKISEFDTKVSEANTTIDAKVKQANTEIDTKVKQAGDSAVQAQASADSVKASSEQIAKNKDDILKLAIKSTQEGNPCVINDSTNFDMLAMDIYGQSSQVQTTGINIFNQEDLLNIDSPNYDKTQSGSGLWFYKVQVKGPVVVSIATTTTTNLYLAVSNTPHTSGIVEWLIHKTSANGKKHIVINEPQNNAIWLGVNNEIEKIKLMLEACRGIMICDGITVKPFEPFTNCKPSPSIDYPQKIVSKKLSEINVAGKNLFDVNKIKTNYIEDRGGIINNGDGTLFVKNHSNDSSVSTNLTLKELCPTLMVGATVILNYKNSNYDHCLIYLSNSRHTVIGKQKFVVKEEDLSSIVRLYPSATNSTSATISDFQIEYGDVVTPYEPFKQPQSITLSQPITLRGIPVTRNGNVTIDGKQYISDVITKKDGVIGVERNISSDINANTLVWKQDFYTIGDKRIYRFSNNNNNIKLRGGLLCNKLKYRQDGVNAEGLISCEETNKIRVCIGDDINNIELFNKFISENELIINYQLSVPTFEPLPEVDQKAIKDLKSYYPNTVIRTGAFTECTYVADPKLFIEKQHQGIQSQIYELQANLITAKISGGGVK